MSSTSDYILEVDNDGSYSYAVYINNTLTELEIPYEDNPDFQIFDLQYSYLEIVDFLTNFGANIDSDLTELWRRIVFNMFVSNTDDHLRNHGFI